MLTKEEYKRLVLKDSRRSTSMFESCLLPKQMQLNPQITARGKVEDSLQADREAFLAKYNTAEGGPSLETLPAELGACRRSLETLPAETLMGAYAFPLPESPQHKKYTLEQGFRRKGIMEKQHSSAPSRPKFNIPTLRKWFAEIDADGGGQVSRRELIVAMRNHRDLQAVLLSAASQSVSSSGGGTSDDAEDVIQAKNAELRRIMAVMNEVDTDNSGTMDWEEFVEFFRRAGFLLEYDTRSSLNESSFKKDGFMNLAASAHSHLKMAELTAEAGGDGKITEDDLLPETLKTQEASGGPRDGSPRSPRSPRWRGSPKDGSPKSPRNPRSPTGLLRDQQPPPGDDPHEEVMLPPHLMTQRASQIPGSLHGAKGLAKTEQQRKTVSSPSLQR